MSTTDSGGLYFKYLPMSSPEAFDNTGQIYDPTRVVVNGVFDVDLYKQYSPLYLPATFVLGYSSVFAGLTAVISHTFGQLLFPIACVPHLADASA